MQATKQRKIAIVGSRSVGMFLRPSIVVSLFPSHAFIDADSLRCYRAGKSSLAVQFVEGQFVDTYYPTIENTFNRVIRYKGQDFATEIVDTAGQVNFSCLIREGLALFATLCWKWKADTRFNTARFTVVSFFSRVL